eukprot:Em0213g2a
MEAVQGLRKARFERETWTYFALLNLHNGRGSYLDYEPLGVLCLVTSARSKASCTSSVPTLQDPIAHRVQKRHIFSSKQSPQQALLHHLVHTERATHNAGQKICQRFNFGKCNKRAECYFTHRCGSQAVVESTLPRPGNVLHQWPRDLQ